MRETWSLNVGIYKSTEAWWLPGAGGGGAWCVNVEGVRVSGWGDEKILETDGSDGCRGMGMFLMPQNYMLQNG